MINTSIDDILKRLQSLQTDLESEIDRLLSEKRALFDYTLKQGRVRFDQGMRALHRRQRVGLWAYLRGARIGHLVTAPVIYSLIIPFVLLDIMATLYQHVCFRVYNLPRVLRVDHFVFDRQHLAYLNSIEKINCLYCGYGNGVITYVREIAARTEQYWCPIKHAQRTQDPHRLVQQFLDYGDADGYRTRLQAIQKEAATLGKGGNESSS